MVTDKLHNPTAWQGVPVNQTQSSGIKTAFDIDKNLIIQCIDGYPVHSVFYCS